MIFAIITEGGLELRGIQWNFMIMVRATVTNMGRGN